MKNTTSSVPVLVGMMRDAGPGLSAVAFQVATKAHGANFIYLTPKDVDVKKRRVNGRYYLNGQWVRLVTRFPDVIDNGENFLHSVEGKSLAKEIPYTNYRLGGKEVISNILDKDDLLRKYLIPYVIADDAKDFFDFIQSFGSVVIKPVFGSSGRKIVKVTAQKDGTFSILFDSSNERIQNNELLHFLNKKMRSRKHIAQKYISSKTNSEIPYDIRIHTCKDINGQWKTAKIYTRLGINKKVTSNIAGGGAIADAKDFLLSTFSSNEGKRLYDEIIHIQNIFPKQLQTHYPYPLSSLGIDIGIDRIEEKGVPYIFEINTGPGSKYLFLEHAMLAAGYAIYTYNIFLNKEDL